jgi:hypothetical protein
MRTKKVKPPKKEHEFILNITKRYDVIKKKDYISFNFNTTKEFLTFRYILKIESKFDDKDLNFNILGFSAPVGELSNSGFAAYEYKMYNYNPGEFIVTVRNRDSESSKFKLIISKSKPNPVKISSVKKESFIKIKSEYDT